jgi:hypothetical protein
VQILRGPAELMSSRQPATLEQAIDELSPLVNAWIVRPALSADPAEVVAAGAPQVTILSSGDEAAVVAAYQIIKQLAEAAQYVDSPVPHIRLAVMGVDQSAAEAAVEKLNRTTVSFLGVEVRLADSLPRMDASIRSTRYMSFANAMIPVLGDVLSQVKDAGNRQPALRRVEPAPDVIGRVHAAHDSHSVRGALKVGGRPLPPSPMRSEVREPANANENVNINANGEEPPIRLRPKPVMDVAAKDAAPPREPDDRGRPIPLAGHVEGLSPLIIRMPGHEQVELAVDGSGRLHVLCQEAALRELRAVEAWTLSHREIITLACPQHTIDRTASVIAHVFTDRPTALADLHNTSLHLHVRAPVVVNGQTGWYIAPLNMPK